MILSRKKGAGDEEDGVDLECAKWMRKGVTASNTGLPSPSSTWLTRCRTMWDAISCGV